MNPVNHIDHKIMVVGDVHGDFSPLNHLVNQKHPKIVLACGDFGYWPRQQNHNSPKIKDGKIYFCDGNHEDFQELKNAPESGELWENVFWMRRGKTLTLPDGRVVLFMGGADSTDRQFRVEGWDWFPEEAISQADLDAIPDCKIDIVVSHTCPMEFGNVSDKAYDDYSNYCRKALSEVLYKVKPAEWYFGHFHTRSLGEYEGCRWTALNMFHEGGCWLWL